MQEGGYIFFERRNGEDIGVFALSFALALLFHAALFAVLPEKFPAADSEKSDEMKLEILPPELKNRVPDFIEANPYGNELVPLKDAPESFKNQTAADELPDPNSKSKLPSVKGEGRQYKKIVAGTNGETDNLSPARVLEVLQRPLTEHTRETQPAPTAAQAQGNRPAQPARQAQAPQAEAAKAAQTAATQATAAASQSPAQSKPAAQAARQSAQSTSAAQSKGEAASNAQSESANIAKPDKIDAARADDTSDENAIVLPKFAKTDTDSARRQADKPALPSAAAAAVAPKPVPVPQPANAAATAVQPAQELPVPKPRPRLSMKIPAGPLADNPNAASKAGVVAAESRFSEFGAYQQRMIEAISRQWNLLGSRYDLSSAIGSQVAIEFSLNTEGELVDCKIVFSTSTNTGTGLCEQAILSTAPYGVWTQEMVNTLGAQPQQVKIKFWYR